MGSCRKHLVLIAKVVLFLATVTGHGAFAQQPATTDRPISKQPVSESNAKPNAQPGGLLTAKPEAPVLEKAAATPDSKEANDRLPFMQNERESHEQAPSATGLLLRTLGALLLIVGLIVAAAYGLKRFGGARFGASKPDAPELAVLNSIALGDRRSLAVVRFGGRTLLVGSTQQSVTLLAEAESDHSVPRVRSVADLLHDNSADEFASELSMATSHLDEPAWKGSDGAKW